jgi:hypothetical protein
LNESVSDLLTKPVVDPIFATRAVEVSTLADPRSVETAEIDVPSWLNSVARWE